MNVLFLILMFLFSAVSGGQSLAAQVGKVIVDEATVYEFPQGKSRPLQTIKKDESVAVSNKPTEGFFKVRTKSGTIGWISGNDVLVGEVAATANPSATPGASDGVVATPSEVPAPAKKTKRDSYSDRKNLKKADIPFSERFRFIAMYGIQTFSYGDLLTVYTANSSDLNSGTGETFEIQYGSSSSFMWAARIEMYSFTGTARNIGTAASPNMQSFTESSLPMMLGAVYSPFTSERFRLGIGAYVGLALATINNQTTVTQTGGAGPGVVTYSSTDLCSALVLQGDIGIFRHLALAYEAEYHYQKTADQKATAFFGGKPSFQINYSGLVLRGGLEFRF